MDAIYKTEIEVKLIQAVGGDHMLAAAAKVSVSPAAAMKLVDADEKENVAGLLNYLMKQRHGTPFEHGLMTFYVHAPIFVFREWHRHRVGWSYNEESARYKPLDPVFYLPSGIRPCVEPKGFKAARPKLEAADPAKYEFLRQRLESGCRASYEKYEQLLAGGIAREVARSVLPVGIYSSMWATCNPRSLMHFLSLRTCDEQAHHPSYPQREIEYAARQMESIFAELYPMTWGAYVRNGREAP